MGLTTRKWNSEEGVFYLNSSSLKDGETSTIDNIFAVAKVVIWKQVGPVAYILVTGEDENNVLATYWLSLFIKSIEEHFKKQGISAMPKEVLPTIFIMLLAIQQIG